MPAWADCSLTLSFLTANYPMHNIRGKEMVCHLLGLQKAGNHATLYRMTLNSSPLYRIKRSGFRRAHFSFKLTFSTAGGHFFPKDRAALSQQPPGAADGSARSSGRRGTPLAGKAGQTPRSRDWTCRGEAGRVPPAVTRPELTAPQRRGRRHNGRTARFRRRGGVAARSPRWSGPGAGRAPGKRRGAYRPAGRVAAPAGGSARRRGGCGCGSGSGPGAEQHGTAARSPRRRAEGRPAAGSGSGALQG